jgi:flagellar biosynthesis/type III secretory pathway protein FliH
MLEETLREWFDGARKEGRMLGRREGRQEGRREGRQKGLQEGLTEGLQKGQIEGMRQMLLRALAERFGKLPERTRRKIGALASAEEMQGLLSRALAAGSLEELGLH